MNSTSVYPEIQLDGVPLWMLILMSSLALLGIIYAICIIIFNLTKAKNKVIKMTSPNINILILVGSICGYCCMVILGLDSGHVGQETMEALHRASTFILTIGSTLIYGSMFAKSWRVFLVFKNINFNGKLTRDEHLLVGILVMVLIDLAILLPWQFADPIKCTRRIVQLTANVHTGEDIQYEVDDCHSSLQGLWVGLIYLYKLLLIVAGLYFTWQTRHVTLPSLKDSTSIYLVVFTLVSMAIVALPTVMMPEVGMKIRYANGVLIIWIVLTVTISLLFIPKIILERKSREAAGNVSAFNFLFSESMRKTQEAVRKCSLCFCCNAQESDLYAQEMLASEIETLKRTIKQKEDTIRELNDRLYIGTEKFQEYLINPKSNRSALKILQDRYDAKKHKSNGVIVSDEPRHEYMQHAESLHDPPAQTIYDCYEDRYEDEGVHSSDSHKPNNYHHLPSGNIQQQETYHSPNQDENRPVHTISNGYISHSLPRRERLINASKPNNFGSLHSLHSVNIKHSHIAADWRSPSPNHDSAYDDHTPSSDGGEKYSVELKPNHHHHQSLTHQHQEYVGTPSSSHGGDKYPVKLIPNHQHQRVNHQHQDYATKPPGGHRDENYPAELKPSYQHQVPNHQQQDYPTNPSVGHTDDKYPVELKPNHYHQSINHQASIATLPSEFVHHHSSPESSGIAQTRQFSQIDLGAMEYDALKNFQRNPSLDNKYIRPNSRHHFGSSTAVSQI